MMNFQKKIIQKDKIYDDLQSDYDALLEDFNKLKHLQDSNPPGRKTTRLTTHNWGEEGSDIFDQVTSEIDKESICFALKSKTIHQRNVLLEEKCVSLQNEMDVLVVNNSTLQTDYFDMENNYGKLKEDYERVNTQANRDREELERLRKENSLFKDEKERLVVENESLKGELDNMRNEKKDIMTTLEDLSKTLEESKVVDYKLTLSDVFVKNRILEEKVRSLMSVIRKQWMLMKDFDYYQKMLLLGKSMIESQYNSIESIQENMNEKNKGLEIEVQNLDQKLKN